MQHLLKPYLHFFNDTQAVAGLDYPYYNLARLAVRLMSRQTYTLPSGPESVGRTRIPEPEVKGSAEANAKAGATAPQPLALSFRENALGYFEVSHQRFHTVGRTMLE